MATKKAAAAKKSKPFVVVRTYSAGVHMGTLEERNGKEVTLSNARRLWRWDGANTLHEVATKGVAETSKVSEPCALVELTEAVEVLHCSAEAQANLCRSRWAE